MYNVGSVVNVDEEVRNPFTGKSTKQLNITHHSSTLYYNSMAEELWLSVVAFCRERMRNLELYLFFMIFWGGGGVGVLRWVPGKEHDIVR
jgi:hypothetical protein